METSGLGPAPTTPMLAPNWSKLGVNILVWIPPTLIIKTLTALDPNMTRKMDMGLRDIVELIIITLKYIYVSILTSRIRIISRSCYIQHDMNSKFSLTRWLIFYRVLVVLWGTSLVVSSSSLNMTDWRLLNQKVAGSAWEFRGRLTMGIFLKYILVWSSLRVN